MNPLTLNPLQIKLALVGLALGAIVVLGLTSWAFYERAGRFSAQVELEKRNTQLQKAVDQVAVLAELVKAQTASIDLLGQATSRGRQELRDMLDELTRSQAAAQNLVKRLETNLAGGTPKRKDGTLEDCRDAIREWKEELKK